MNENNGGNNFSPYDDPYEASPYGSNYNANGCPPKNVSASEPVVQIHSQPAPAPAEQPAYAASPQKAEAVKATPAAKIMSGVRVKIMATTAVVAAWIALAGLLFGSLQVFGGYITVFTIIEFIVSFFGIRLGAIYVSLAKPAIAVVFIVMLVLVIKNVVSASRKIFSVYSVKVKNNDPEYPQLAMRRICGCASFALKYAYIFMIVASVLLECELTVWSWILIAAGVLHTMVIACCSSWPESRRNEAGKRIRSKESWMEFAFAAARQALIDACFIMMALFLVVPAGYEIAFNLQALFGVYYNDVYGFFDLFINIIGRYIIDIVAIIMFMTAVDIPLCSYDPIIGYRKTMDKDIFKKCLRILIAIAVAVAITCVFSVLDSNGKFSFNDAVFGMWWNLLRLRYIPVILSAVIGMIVSSYMKREA